MDKNRGDSRARVNDWRGCELVQRQELSHYFFFQVLQEVFIFIYVFTVINPYLQD
jgi:hypothetical protein